MRDRNGLRGGASRLAASLSAALLVAGCGSGGSDEAAGTDAKAASGAELVLDIPPAPANEQALPPENVAAEIPANLSANEEATPSPEAEPPSRPKAPAEDPARPAAPAPAPPAEEPPAAESPAPEAAAPPAPAAGNAPLPLPGPVIARTIGRIGFPCGSVVSSSRVTNAAGQPVFRINCSSGAAYRGSTRNGRMYFRPWPGD